MTRLRDLWRLLGDLLTGRLARRVTALENELARQDRWHARWEQETVKLDHYAKSKTQALSREVGKLQLSVHALAVRTAEQLTVEQALTLDDDEETSCVISLDADSKT